MIRVGSFYNNPWLQGEYEGALSLYMLSDTPLETILIAFTQQNKVVELITYIQHHITNRTSLAAFDWMI